ncbi:MAG TPA: polyhydroxyalkanoic acid system family protein [Pirellulales bacterium]|nr:polyhydroxyalkanoic acid system family protein [Pirellulales bacterium]
MPKISVTVPHQLSQQDAGERLKHFLAKLKDEQKDRVSDLREEWTDNGLKFSFKSFGFQFQGTGTLEPSDVKLDLDIPFAAMMFKGKIESDIRETLARALQ